MQPPINKETGVTMLVSEKIGFGKRSITRDKDQHFIMTWHLNRKKNTKYIYNYNKVSKYKKQKIALLEERQIYLGISTHFSLF